MRDYSADSQGEQVNKILQRIEQKNHGLLSSLPSQYLSSKNAGNISLEKQDSDDSTNIHRQI